MNPTTITFLRHGETNLNVKKCYFGHLNPSLNSEGYNQVKKTANILANSKFDYIYSSDLNRAVESAKIVNEFHKLEIKYSKKLREMNFGIFEGKNYEEIQNEFPIESNEYFDNWKDYEIPQGESLSLMKDRCLEIIENIIKKHKGKSILIISHSGVIKILLSHYICSTLDSFWKFKVDHASMTKLMFNDDNYVYADYINRI